MNGKVDGGNRECGVRMLEDVNLVRSPILRSFKGSSHNHHQNVVNRSFSETEATSGIAKVHYLGGL